MKASFYFSASAVLCLSLFACSTPSPKQHGGYYKVGKPYQIAGQWYYPQVEEDYKETGTASWYGHDFHGKHTANGDKFDKNALTAAHRTLPLPSMVKVTNLNNNKSLIVMVNDRGPFSKGRIIDVSERAAEILEFKNNGTAKVRVEYMKDQSNQLLAGLSNVGPDSKKTKKQSVLASRETTNDANADLNLEPASNADPITTIPVRISGNEGQYFIQLGAFSSEESALNLKTSLAENNAHIIPLEKNSSTLYRVRIGPLTTKEEAETLLENIGQKDARIVAGE